MAMHHALLVPAVEGVVVTWFIGADISVVGGGGDAKATNGVVVLGVVGLKIGTVSLRSSNMEGIRSFAFSSESTNIVFCSTAPKPDEYFVLRNYTQEHKHLRYRSREADYLELSIDIRRRGHGVE